MVPKVSLFLDLHKETATVSACRLELCIQMRKTGRLKEGCHLRFRLCFLKLITQRARVCAMQTRLAFCGIMTIAYTRVNFTAALRHQSTYPTAIQQLDKGTRVEVRIAGKYVLCRELLEEMTRFIRSFYKSPLMPLPVNKHARMTQKEPAHGSPLKLSHQQMAFPQHQPTLVASTPKMPLAPPQKLSTRD